MNFLLDTNVVSEWTKPRPNDGVIAWLAGVDEDRVFLSVVTLAEVRLGIERLPSGQRRTRLEAWLVDDLAARFEGRLLPITAETADRWGRVVARAQSAGRVLAAMDAWIVATCEQHGLTLVTRDVADLASSGVDVLNPWGPTAVARDE